MAYQTYKVKSGDTLSAIARKLGISNWRDLYELNKSLIGGNPNYIKVGQVFNVPGTEKKTATKSTVTPAKTTEQIAAEAAKDVPKIRFEDMLSFEDFFPGELARSSAAQRTSRYYDPLVQEGQESLMSDYAGRGLSRSGARGKGIMDLYRETADQEATMREQLYGAQESQAKEDYGYQRGLYEDNPSGYEKTTAETPTYEYQYPEESPQKYSSSYKNWLKSAFKI